MSLLQVLSYKDYQKALLFSEEQCLLIAERANIRHITFQGSKKPGEVLLRLLDRKGFTIQQYKNLTSTEFNKKSINYRPDTKIAILIGNAKYVHLPKLATPSNDCKSLSRYLKNLGFNVITLMDVDKITLMSIVFKIFKVVPENSYCFIFYAGHGCEIDGKICMLGVECPSENIQLCNVVTQNEILMQVENFKPELNIIIMDMCRVQLDSPTNIQEQISQKNITAHNNLILCYSTQSSSTAYEELQIYCSESIDRDYTYKLNSDDLLKVVSGTSQYVTVLCQHLNDDVDVDTMLDRVHKEVEQSVKSQKPMKVRFGESKRSLHDPAKGNTKSLYIKLKEIGNELQDTDNSKLIL